jgi:predicted extracellular nuclease
VTTGTGFWGGNAFYVQDDTAGIYVYTTSATVAPGDRVRLEGKTSTFGGELQLQPSAIEILSSGNELPETQTIEPSGVNEETQGERITLERVTITNLRSVNSFGTFEFQAIAENGEQIAIRNDNRNGLTFDQFTAQYKEGDLIHVSGIASKFNSTYQVKTLGFESFDLVNKPAVYVDVFPGVVSEGTSITLASGMDDATIYYTLDGSTPTTNSAVYAEPIVLTKDTVIKAIAVNGETSEVFTFDYTVLKTTDLKIRDIQGQDHYSDYEGAAVSEVTGVITHFYNGANFVMQDTEDDGDWTTSEAIIVNRSSASSSFAVGDVVTVAGTVEEWFYKGYSDMRDNDLPLTRIRSTDVVKTGTAELPEPIIIGEDVFPPTQNIDNDGLTVFEPEEDGIDFWESLELMRVGVADAQILGPQRYGEVFVVSQNATNNDFHKQDGILLSEDDFNPERITVTTGEGVVAKAGDTFAEAPVGVLGYGFGNYQIWTEADELPEIVDGGVEPEETWIENADDKLTVSTYNVENYSADPNHTSDEKAQRIAESFVEDLNSPDIIAMVEVQDNDGPIDSGNSDASASYERLIADIQTAGGPVYAWTDIAPEYNKDGGQPGGNIRVGFLYNPERVDLSEGEKGTATQDNSWTESGDLALNPGRVQPIPMPGTRKPLAAQFEFQGEEIVVIATHLNSKGGDQGLMGQNQPPEFKSEVERIELAHAINGFIEQGLEKNPELNVVVTGDMNDFEFTPALKALEGDILTNKVNDVPEEDRFSYYYQGNSQVLDHLLVTNNLADNTELDMVHINSMFMEEHGRASDHDPLLAQISFDKEEEPVEEPQVPGEQQADPDLSGNQATIEAGEFDADGTLDITFTQGTIDELLESGKDLTVNLEAANFTFTADNLKQLAQAAGEGMTLALAVDDAQQVDNRPALTQQLDIAVLGADGAELDITFNEPLTLNFLTNPDVKVQFGARQDDKGKWKIIQGDLNGETFTLEVNEFGNYTVITNKGQLKKSKK